MEPKNILKAAIYTRKSSEEGLEREFNSLDAQREACKAYITSQKHEGWVFVDKEYSDGGISGGTLNRPAIQELLRDIKEGAVDMIVVYKIDRLTRSLHDFSKLVEIFDEHQASFVSITQQFNTSTSMGRLTLNMLLSFAQFEREISGERVRDKKLAMVKKGLWTNGQVPHGYKVEKCIVSPDPQYRDEPKIIFEEYLKLGSVLKLQERLEELSIRTRNNKPWHKGPLYNLLRNKTYLGKIPYKGEILEGQHEPLIPKELFDKVQEMMQTNHRAHRVKSKAKDASLLVGLLYGSNGDKYYPSHSTKKMATPKDGGSIAGAHGCAEQCKRYRYYLSKEVSKHQKVRTNPLAQIPAQEIEDYIKAFVPKLL